MKKKTPISALLIVGILITCFVAHSAVADDSATKMTDIPDHMIVNEEQWNSWTAKRGCKLFPFMDASGQAGFTFSIPWGQEKSIEKTVEFAFQDKNGNHLKLENAEMYYAVEDQTIIYAGLSTSDKAVFESKEFMEACVCLMLAYNCHYDAGKGGAMLNLTHERAEEITEYCLDHIEHCLVDDMRIRVIRNDTKPYYSFHMEY